MWKWLDDLTCKIGIHDKMLIPCGYEDKELCWFCTNCFKKCFAEAPAPRPKNEEKSGGYWYGVEIPPAPPMPSPRPKGPPNTTEKEWDVK